MPSDTTTNVKGLARIIYGTDEPSRAMTNHVAKLCREGKVPAVKCGRRWVVRIEWPTVSEGGKPRCRKSL